MHQPTSQALAGGAAPTGGRALAVAHRAPDPAGPASGYVAKHVRAFNMLDQLSQYITIPFRARCGGARRNV